MSLLPNNQTNNDPYAGAEEELLTNYQGEHMSIPYPTMQKVGEYLAYGVPAPFDIFTKAVGEWLRHAATGDKTTLGEAANAAMDILNVIPQKAGMSVAGVGAIKGMKRVPAFWHGTGDAESLEKILAEGYTRGSSSELKLTGTSLSRDPIVSWNYPFGMQNADNVLINDVLVPKEEIYNMRPSEYFLKQVNPEAKVYNKPNSGFNEAETFALRGHGSIEGQQWFDLADEIAAAEKSGDLKRIEQVREKRRLAEEKRNYTPVKPRLPTSQEKLQLKIAETKFKNYKSSLQIYKEAKQDAIEAIKYSDPITVKEKQQIRSDSFNYHMFHLLSLRGYRGTYNEAIAKILPELEKDLYYKIENSILESSKIKILQKAADQVKEVSYAHGAVYYSYQKLAKTNEELKRLYIDVKLDGSIKYNRPRDTESTIKVGEFLRAQKEYDQAYRKYSKEKNKLTEELITIYGNRNREPLGFIPK